MQNQTISLHPTLIARYEFNQELFLPSAEPSLQ